MSESPRFDGAYCSTAPLTGEMTVGMLERSSGYLWWLYQFHPDGRLSSESHMTKTGDFPATVAESENTGSAVWTLKNGEVAMSSLIDPFHEGGSAQARVGNDGALTFTSGATCKFVPFTA